LTRRDGAKAENADRITDLIGEIAGPLIHGEAMAQIGKLPYTQTKRPLFVEMANWFPSSAAALVGLDSLSAVSLPAGYRELRVELECGACTPFYLIRIVQTRGGDVRGDGYILWSRVDSLKRTDSSARAYATMIAQESTRLGCTPRTAENYTYCRIQPRHLSWTAILGSLDSLGMTTIGADTGYAPPPPRPLSGPGSVQDTLTGAWWQNFVCGDIGSLSIIVEILSARAYRNASFRCLESRRAGGNRAMAHGTSERPARGDLPVSAEAV
jgi:hypothetical protein